METDVTRPLALLLLVGCARAPEPADYDDTRAVDDDCDAVVVEGWCGACSQVAALNVADAGRFVDDQAAFADRVHCRTYLAPACAEIDPDAVGVRCDHGTCATDAEAP